MRVDHVLDVFLLEAVVGHLLEQIRQILCEPRIDQGPHPAPDKVAVTVVLEINGPLVNENVIFIFDLSTFF
jgi:hypothetical protein